MQKGMNQSDPYGSQEIFSQPHMQFELSPGTFALLAGILQRFLRIA